MRLKLQKEMGQIMNNLTSPDHTLLPGLSMKRKPLAVGQNKVIREALLQQGRTLPLVVEPEYQGVDLISWAASQESFIKTRLSQHGAILFRNFKSKDVNIFESFIRTVSGELLEYRERSSPRHQVSGNVYTSTDYPARQSIFMHNENSYQSAWPLRLFFFCVTAAQKGGETPIADVRKVLQRIDPKTRARFKEKKIMYVRNYDDGLGLSWQTVFQSEDKSAVNAYCEAAGIEVEWRDGNRLRTRQVAQAILAHPQTGEEVWFNHAAFFHISTLDPAIGSALIEAVGEENLPNNTYYGDGSRIEPSVLDEIRDAYRQEMVAFAWQEGDILMLDNMLAAHGRNPYSGPRKILVGMTEPFSRASI